MKRNINKIPSILERLPSVIKIRGKMAEAITKKEVVRTVRLWAGMPPLANKATMASAAVKAAKLFPVISPKESWGMPRRAADIPTNKLGKEAAAAITKKATTNSLNFKNLVTVINPSTTIFPAK